MHSFNSLSTKFQKWTVSGDSVLPIHDPAQSARRGKADKDGDDWSPWLLTFNEAATERAFVVAHHDSLWWNTRALCVFIFAGFAVNVVSTGADFETSFSQFQPPDKLPETVDRQAFAMLVSTRNTIILANIVLAFVAIVAGSVGALKRRVDPFQFELAVSFLLTIFALEMVFQSAWYLAKLYGVCGVVQHPEIRDLYLLTGLDCLITIAHIFLPIRWHLLIPMEVAAGSLYLGCTFCVGSFMSSQDVSTNGVILLALIACASLGRRYYDQQERRAFLNLIRQKNLRVEAEFQVETLKLEPRRRKTGGEETSSFVGSLPSTSASVNFFGTKGSLTKDTAEGYLREVEAFARNEHYLISQNELQFDRLQVLGAGAFGVVLEAQFQGAQVTLKTSRQSAIEGLYNFDHITQELSTFRRLHHPNIVCCLGAYIVPSLCEFGLVLEYLDGERLDRFAQAPPKGPNSRVRLQLSLDVCSALRYLHTRQPKIVHGDLKDSNIFVQFGQGLNVKAKLLDFGLARILTKKARPLGGTKAWKAPELLIAEQANTSLRPSTAADIFSLGRILYKISTGTVPNEGSRGLHQIDEDKPPAELEWPEGSLPSAFRPIVDTCSQAQPSCRPCISKVMADLKAIPVEVAPPELCHGGFCCPYVPQERGEARTFTNLEDALSHAREVANREAWKLEPTLNWNFETGLSENGAEPPSTIGDNDGPLSFSSVPSQYVPSFQSVPATFGPEILEAESSQAS